MTLRVQSGSSRDKETRKEMPSLLKPVVRSHGLRKQCPMAQVPVPKPLPTLKPPAIFAQCLKVGQKIHTPAPAGPQSSPRLVAECPIRWTRILRITGS